MDATDAVVVGLLVADEVGNARKTRILGSVFVVLLLIGLMIGANALMGEKASDTSFVEGQPTSTNWRPYSVVAPIDTGINVYHDHFRTNETYPDWLLDGLGVTKTCTPTFNGTWQERFDADKATCWDTITTSDIVYFKGTKSSERPPMATRTSTFSTTPRTVTGTAVTERCSMQTPTR